MAIGDAAAAAGMNIVDGATTEARNIDTEINRTRDYIADGAGATSGNVYSKAVKRDANGRIRFSTGVDADQGATKWYVDTTLADAIDGIDVTWEALTGKPSSFPSSWSQVADKPTLVSLGYFNDRLAPGASSPIYVRGDVVTNSYVAMYRNGDGRVGISPSARRFKKNIVSRPYTLDDALAIDVVNYQLRADVYGSTDAPVEVGVIAEQLIDAGLGEFVVYDEDGDPLSVHYERIALVALGALRDVSDALDVLADRIEQMEAHNAGD